VNGDDVLTILRHQQQAIRFLVLEAEARLGMHSDEASVSQNKKRVFRAKEHLDKASLLIDRSASTKGSD
jgi:hypothetical protein